MWKSWYFHRCTSATVPCLWRMRRCLSGAEYPWKKTRTAKLICDQIISFEDAQAARAANQPLFPRNYGGRGGSSRGGSYGNGSGNGGAGGYRNAGNGYGQYQNDGMNSSSMSVGQTVRQQDKCSPGSVHRQMEPLRKRHAGGSLDPVPPIWRPIRPESRNCCRPLRIPTGDDDGVIYLRDIKKILRSCPKFQVKSRRGINGKSLHCCSEKKNVKFITKPIEKPLKK